MFFSTHWVYAVVKLLESPQCTNFLYRKLCLGAQDGVFPSQAGAGSIVVFLTVEDVFSALLHFQKLCLLETIMGVFPIRPHPGPFLSAHTFPHSSGQKLGPDQESTPLPPLPRGKDGTANQLSTFEKDLQ